MSRLIPILRLLILTIVFGALLFSSSPGPIVASGPIKLWSGIHLGNRPGADWNSTLLADIDGDRPGGTWPKAVVFLSSQLYYLSRDADCRIKTGPNDTITNRPVLLDYLQRASQSGVRIIIRIHPSPGNFDTDHNLLVDPIPGIGYCDWNNHRPADDIADEMIAIHNYNQAHGITEWGFEPANEPNAEWYPWNSPPEWPRPNELKAWQDMNEYFKAVWLSVPTSVHALTPPMAQDAFAEMNHTGPHSIEDPDPYKWCLPMRLEDKVSTGYGVMQSYYTTYNDGIDWHNYWRLGWENSGTCSAYALHVSYYFPQWMKDILESGSKPGTITEADLFSYGQPPNQDPNQPLHNKDDVYGWPAANSLRKFFQKEARAQALVAWLLNDNVNHPDQDHNWHEAYNDETGDSRRIWFAKWWQYFERWASPWFLPDIRRDFNGWNSTIVVRNNGGDTAWVEVNFYDQNGVYKGRAMFSNLPGNAAWEVPLPSGLSDFSGSAVVYSDQDVSVVVMNYNSSSGRTYAYNGIISGGSGDPTFERTGTTLYAPSFYNNAWGWTSTLEVMNTGSATANVQIQFKGRAGYGDTTPPPYTISPNGRLEVAASSVWGSTPWVGSLVVESTNGQPLAAVVHEHHTSQATRAYNASSAGSSPIYVPAAYKNKWGMTSGLVVQNVGSGPTTAHLYFYDRGGTPSASRSLLNIGAGRAQGLWLGNEDALPDVWTGWVRVVSSNPLAVYVNTVRPEGHYAYTGASQPGNTVTLPYAAKNANGRSTGYTVLNTNDSEVQVTANYYNGSGSEARWPEVYWLGPRAVTGRHQALDPYLWDGWTGSIVLQDSEPLVAVMREDSSNTTSAYNGVAR